MFDDYKDKQQIVYNLLMNEINNNQISHAYLFDENNNSESFDIIMSFVKEILCFELSNEEANILRTRIDDNNYPEIKIIEPDGMLIKKQQILDLQREFSMMATEGKKRIYIIRDCEKMRPETANSMLKFLEEPSNDIVAILMTNNYNNLLPTIISRCQIVRLENNMAQKNGEEFDALALKFINSIEKNGIRSTIDLTEILGSDFNIKDRDLLTNFFDKLVSMYYDIMKINIDSKNNDNIRYYNNLFEISNMNKYDELLRKIDYLVMMKDRIKYNVNCSLLLDSVITVVGGKIWE